ncbi:hypothetical protein EVAR_78892_1 [Eumeta japonica]|uniref:Extracellular serine/threonine protein kinase four-jointed n=1 Tax=Eumeta variegata TaxID=151549 RepID=A0A4C1U2D1_EUMVA|nr:hypothetical protein EVAR_78892_1 [Eumeta japonica]
MEIFNQSSTREDKITLCSNRDGTAARIKNIEEKYGISRQNPYTMEKTNEFNDVKALARNINFTHTYGDTHKENVNSENYHPRRENIKCMTFCFLSVSLAFVLGLIIGVSLVNTSRTLEVVNTALVLSENNTERNYLNTEKTNIKTDSRDISQKLNFETVSFTGPSLVLAKENHKGYDRDVYPKGMSDDMKDILKDNKEGREHKVEKTIYKVDYTPSERTVIFDDIYWGPLVESSLPEGYGAGSAEVWEKYVDKSEVAKMETGCGRMQNRLVTFQDGVQACVRYRQNTDQIQGEIFSFYVGRLLNLTNLAPSVIRIVDTKDRLWRNVATDIGAAQWNSNRAVVMTQYVPSLESATIPEVFKPSNRHLNKFDILKMALRENGTLSKTSDVKLQKSRSAKSNIDIFSHIDMNINKKTIDLFVELAQWSDLIVFDYLTANLDRIVNNLFNFQWNANIMDGPAHNLARRIDTGLLMFLDNESGLLHGYRLLKKYNVYHGLMLENLCLFRKGTVEALKALHRSKAVGLKLSDLYHRRNDAVIRDVLPSLPEKNVKILHERIGSVLSQVEKCEADFSKR